MSLPSPAIPCAIVTASAAAVPSSSSDAFRSEEHTSELQSLTNLVCRLLLEKKKRKILDGPYGEPNRRSLSSHLGARCVTGGRVCSQCRSVRRLSSREYTALDTLRHARLRHR